MLTDLDRGLFLVRTYTGFNYTSFDLHRARPADRLQLLPLAQLSSSGGDGMSQLAADQAVSQPHR